MPGIAGDHGVGGPIGAHSAHHFRQGDPVADFEQGHSRNMALPHGPVGDALQAQGLVRLRTGRWGTEPACRAA